MRLPERQSLISQTAEILRECIRAGEWKSVVPGEWELARRLEISRVTLRAALAELEREGWIGRSGRGRRRPILTGSRSLALARPGSTPRVVVLTSQPLHRLPAFQVLLIDELRQHLARRGAGMEIMESSAAGKPRPDSKLLDAVKSSNAQAWMLMRCAPALQRWFQRQKIPAVVAGTRAPDIGHPSVDTDHRAASRHAAGRLVSCGHQQIAFIAPEFILPGDEESEHGFREGAGRANVRVIRHDGSRAGLARVLDRLLQTDSPPTALFVLQPTHAAAVQSHLLVRGIRIPAEVSLVSRDDDPFLDHLSPVLTRYRANPARFAKLLERAVDAVLGGMHGGNASLLMPDFVAGETVAPPAAIRPTPRNV